MFSIMTLVWIVLGMFIGWYFVSPPKLAHDLLANLVERYPALKRYQRDDV
jgi:hypothetical protein